MQIYLVIEFLLAPLVLISLLLMTAPYGRHFKPGWGPALPNRLAWMLMELPALLVISILVLTEPLSYQPIVLIPLSMWVVHYAYRSFVFPYLMHPSNNTFPVQLVVYAVLFNVLNGKNNADALLMNAQQDGNWLSLHFVVGFCVFIAGFIIHIQSDNIIRRLRKPGETGYQIPYGGLFEKVSSPQYLGEMIQWFGWALMTASLAGLAFALFTVCNLLPRAVSNQRWYRQQFPDYPKQRKILIPGLF